MSFSNSVCPSGCRPAFRRILNSRVGSTVIFEDGVDVFRDFSVTDPTVPADRVGKLLAFAPLPDGGITNGQKHLQGLVQAGLPHVHVLPVFDIATVDEDPANRVDIGDQFSKLCAKNSAVPAATCNCPVRCTCVRQPKVCGISP